MEHRVAGPDETIIDGSFDMVSRASAYVGLIARRCGHCPDAPRNPSQFSISRMEFEEARRLGLTTLVFIMSDSHPAVPNDEDTLPARERKRRQAKLAAYRAEATKDGRLCEPFDSLADITAKAAHGAAALRRHFDGRPTDDPSGHPDPDWIPLPAKTPTSLASVAIHPLVQLNSRPTCYYLSLSLQLPIDADHFPVGRRHTIAIGLSRLQLSMSSNAFQPAHASLLGGPARPQDGVVAIATDKVSVSAPPGALMLTGAPLGDTYFCVIEPLATSPRAPSVTARITAAPTDFTFRLVDDGGTGTPAPLSRNKHALAAIAFGKALADNLDKETGRLVLGSATLRRLPRKLVSP
jgi:hypothetical protein